MQILNIENKLNSLNSDTKVRFNMNIHGKVAGQELAFGQLTEMDKINVRRRISDNDNSVEIIETKLTVDETVQTKSKKGK